MKHDYNRDPADPLVLLIALIASSAEAPFQQIPIYLNSHRAEPMNKAKDGEIRSGAVPDARKKKRELATSPVSKNVTGENGAGRNEAAKNDPARAKQRRTA